MTREDRREKDAAVAARHRAEGGTRYWLDNDDCFNLFFCEGREKQKRLMRPRGLETQAG